MPFTPTHIVAILSIALFAPGVVGFSALVIGSMVPDWPLFVPFPADYATTHSIRGLFLACLPLGLGVYLLFHGILKRPITGLLPRPIETRVASISSVRVDLSVAGVLGASLAIIVGAATHLFWDSFTHHDRWGTRLVPALEQTALTFGSQAVPGYKLLQYGSTFIGLPGLAILLGLWLIRREPQTLDPESRSRSIRKIGAWSFGLAVPVFVTMLVLFQNRGSRYEQLGRLIQMTGQVLLTSILVYCGFERLPSYRGFAIFLRAIKYALALGFTILGISSYLAYTTAGLDFEEPTDRGVDVFYLRLRWDEGSTWLGYAIQPCPRPGRELDWFDPGGTLFATSTHPTHRSTWNDRGFWWVDGPEEDPYLTSRYPGATVSRWWACPSWLICVGIWLPGFIKGGDRMTKTVFRQRPPG